MNTKLTLNLNKSIIEDAKYYAKENEISLLVKSLTGIIPNDTIDERKDYRDYIAKKYL
jgi:hypothetical protein